MYSIFICNSKVKWRLRPIIGRETCNRTGLKPFCRFHAIARSMPEFQVIFSRAHESAKSDSELRLVCLYVCPRGTTWLPVDGVDEIWYLSFLRKSVEKMHLSSKSSKNNWYSTWTSSAHTKKYIIFIYKVVQIWPGLFVCKQVTVCPGHIWTTLYFHCNNSTANARQCYVVRIFLFCY